MTTEVKDMSTIPAVKAASVYEQRFDVIPLGYLRESADNPRKHFDEARLAELVESVKAHGVRTPLLVRPIGGGGHVVAYEIAAGHRRFRAAQAAGLEEVPVVVRDMDDREFLELLTFENLQREDVHPLEEAEGYRKLLAQKAGYDVARIAERIGKSVKYVYDRMRLLSLIRAAQELFREDRITAGHAILLARLKPEDQERVIDLDEGGLWTRQRVLLNPEYPEAGDERNEWKPVSVLELKAWIDERIRFDIADEVVPQLFPATAEAVETATEARERVIHITHDRKIAPSAKGEQRTYTADAWRRADGRDGSETCESAVTGVVVVGYGRGEAFKVCTAKKKCGVHWREEIEIADRRAKGEDPAVVTQQRDDYQDAWRKQQQREEAERQRWADAKPAILAAIASRLKKASASATGPLGDLLVGRGDARSAETKAEQASAAPPRGRTAEDLVRYMAFVILGGELESWNAQRSFPALAKAVGVDVKPLLAGKAAKAPAEVRAPKAAGKSKARKPAGRKRG